MADRRSWLSAMGVLAIVVAVACSDEEPETAATSDSSTTTTAVEQPAGEELRLGEFDAVRIQVPSPDWLVADESFVYVKLDDGAVSRIDPATGAVLDTAEIAGQGGCRGPAVRGSAWASRASGHATAPT